MPHFFFHSPKKRVMKRLVVGLSWVLSCLTPPYVHLCRLWKQPSRPRFTWYDVDTPRVVYKDSVSPDWTRVCVKLCDTLRKCPLVWNRVLYTSFPVLYTHHLVYQCVFRFWSLHLKQIFDKECLFQGRDGHPLRYCWSRLPTVTNPPPFIVVLHHSLCANLYEHTQLVSMLMSHNVLVLTYTRRHNEKKIEPVTLPVFHHLGYVEDLEDILDHIVCPVRDAYDTNIPIYMFGTSAGAPTIMNYLGRHKTKGKVDGVMVVSSGYSFEKVIAGMPRRWDRLFVNRLNRFFVRPFFVKKEKTVDKQNDMEGFQKASSLMSWHSHHARLLGFRNLSDYWKTYDPIHIMSHIMTPVLYLHSRDDPIILYDHLGHDVHKVSEWVCHVTTEKGSHGVFTQDGVRPPYMYVVACSYFNSLYDEFHRDKKRKKE